MTRRTATSERVWRVSAPGRGLAMLLAAAPTGGAVAAWVGALVNRSPDAAGGALAVTGVAAVLWVFVWWVALRPRLELTADQVVVVNPWGTQRVPLADVVMVTRGHHAARLGLSDGFWVSSWALSEGAGAWPQRDRVAEVAAAVEHARRRAERLSSG